MTCAKLPTSPVPPASARFSSPDIYYAALMAGPSFFEDPRTQAIAQGATAGEVPWEQAIDDNADLNIAVAKAAGTDATGVKIYANLSGHLVAGITRAAHGLGMRVWAHGMVFPATPQEVVDAGVDTVSHTCYLAYQAMTKRPDSYQRRFPIDFRSSRTTILRWRSSTAI